MFYYCICNGQQFSVDGGSRRWRSDALFFIDTRHANGAHTYKGTLIHITFFKL